jgi:pyruvate/2-oxoglutarate dehydrogenase complex dihydrolipoamide acyltransferase (E2) component
MPKFGSAESGTVLCWFVAEGDEINQGQTLAEIETEKVTVELESPTAGRIRSLMARPNEEVRVGTVIAEIDS